MRNILLVVCLVGVVPLVSATWELPEGQERMWFLEAGGDDLEDGDGEEAEGHRGLQSCPHNTTPFKTFYNVLFNLVSERETGCSTNDLKVIGEILQNDFDKLVLDGDEDVSNGGGGFDTNILSSKTDVCTAVEDLRQQSSSNNNNNNNRRLARVFRIILFRSIGKCFMCSKDNHDRQLRALQTQEEANLYFATVIDEMQDYLNRKLTRRVNRKALKSGVTCLRNKGAAVETTVAIKFWQLQQECADVYCCATKTNPADGCANTYGATNFCHSTRSRCELECNGVWVNAHHPPQCKGHYSQCSGRNDNRCCGGSKCHSYDNRYWQCTPLGDLGFGQSNGQCIPEWQSCHGKPNDCCNGLRCYQQQYWSQCRFPNRP